MRTPSVASGENPYCLPAITFYPLPRKRPIRLSPHPYCKFSVSVKLIAGAKNETRESLTYLLIFNDHFKLFIDTVLRKGNS